MAGAGGARGPDRVDPDLLAQLAPEVSVCWRHGQMIPIGTRRLAERDSPGFQKCHDGAPEGAVAIVKNAGDAGVVRCCSAANEAEADRMFAALARDSGAVVDDPALVDIAETLFAAFAEAGEEWLTHEQMRFACRGYPGDQFDNRLRVLKGLGAIREVFPKPHQLRYRASFTSVVGLMFIRRMMDDGGQSEMHRLLALEDLNVADPRTTMDEARQSAVNLARAFRRR